ncbi:MAG: hypothetical protein WA991_07210 [Ornithinimicrobium sp.]
MTNEQPGTDPRVDREHVVPVDGPRRRHQPRMVPFLMTFAIIGGVFGVVLSLTGPASRVASAGQEMIVLGGAGALVFGMVGAVVYLIVEWRSLRRR